MGKFNGVARDSAGNRTASPTVTVYLAGTSTLASIFSDPALATPKANPFTGPDNGVVEFFASDGDYRVLAQKTGFPDQDIDYVEIGAGGDPVPDPLDLDTLRTAIHPTYDVTHPDFGAVFDGVTDDRAAIQAAIDAAAAKGGGVVQLPEGIGQLAAQLVMKSNVWLRGMGDSTALRPTAALSGDMIVLENVQTLRCALTDMRLSGRGPAMSPAVDAVNFINTGWTGGVYPFHQFRNLYIENFPGEALRVTGAHLCKATNVVAFNCVTGIVWESPDGELTACTSFAHDNAGFRVLANSNRLTNCKSGSNDGIGFELSSFNLQLSACEAQDNALSGYYINGAVDNARGNTLVGCTAHKNEEYGFRLGANATGNLIVSPATDQLAGSVQLYGVFFDSGATENLVILSRHGQVNGLVGGTQDGNRVVSVHEEYVLTPGNCVSVPAANRTIVNGCPIVSFTAAGTNDRGAWSYRIRPEDRGKTGTLVVVYSGDLASTSNIVWTLTAHARALGEAINAGTDFTAIESYPGPGLAGVLLARTVTATIPTTVSDEFQRLTFARNGTTDAYGIAGGGAWIVVAYVVYA